MSSVNGAWLHKDKRVRSFLNTPWTTQLWSASDPDLFTFSDDAERSYAKSSLWPQRLSKNVLLQENFSVSFALPIISSAQFGDTACHKHDFCRVLLLEFEL